MKNVVSFDTAKALRAAGFPQPESEFGQIWYDDHGQPILCIEKIKGQDKWNFRNRHDASLCVNTAFAPTATDIMSELTPACFLMKDFPAKGVILWRGQVEVKKGVIEYRTSKYDNPAEAAAELWAYLNKK